MIQKLGAIYENGVLRLLEPIELEEHEQVTLSLEVSEAPAAPAVPSLCEPEGRPWRGVFATEYPRVPVFSQEMDLSDLPHWEPQVTVNRHWIDDE